jgi:hypothetical protein
MVAIEDNIAAYDAIREELEKCHKGKWVLFHDCEFIDAYDDFQDVASDAVARFGRGPYLIRQVGALPMTLPSSVLYHPDHGNQVRV